MTEPETVIAPEPVATPAPVVEPAPEPVVVRTTRTQSSAEPARADSHPAGAIAVVGMSGRYPVLATLDEYWRQPRRGPRLREREIPASRWDVAGYYDPRPHQDGKVTCKWMGHLDDIDLFDPLFFGIPPAEAESMDPQQRLFLQEAYHAFEDAGYDPSSLSGRKCGVYLGIMSSEYGMLMQPAERRAGCGGHERQQRHHRGTHRLLPQPQGPRDRARHRLLVLAGRHPPGGAGPAQR